MAQPAEEAEAERLFEASRTRIAGGARDEAEALLHAALELAPDHVRALNNLALLRGQAGDETEARRLLERAAAAGGSAKIWANLGRARRRAGELEAAIAALRSSLELEPIAMTTWLSLGEALEQAGRGDEALLALERAVEIEPASAAAHNNVGLLLQRRGERARGLEALARAAALDPASPEMASNHGDALRHARRFGEARRELERAAGLDGARYEPWQALGRVQHHLGLVEAATCAARRAWELAPRTRRASTGSTYLYFASHDASLTRDELLELHLRWGREARAQALEAPGASEREAQALARCGRSGGRLKLGYLSADFREHVVMKFFEPVLEAHDSASIDVYLLSATKEHDLVSERLATMCRWVELRDAPLDEQRRRIAELELDAIVELGGHTSEGVVEVLALRLAPLQLTWLGYPGTTGLETIDVRITDDRVDPPGCERDYVERLARLGRTAWAYSSRHPVDVGPAPTLRGGLAMGSFNRLGKVSQATLSLWCEALERVPESTLVVRASAIDELEVRARLEADFAARGLRDRVELRGWVESPERALAEIAEVDVVLDTFPYHGTTTTCDALSVGTPVVSLVGETPAARVSPSLLAEVGLEELAVTTQQAFVAKLVELADGVDELRRARAVRVDRYRASGLSDAAALAKAIEQVILESLAGG